MVARFWLFAMVLGFAANANAQTSVIHEAQRRCAEPLPGEVSLKAEEFSWNMSRSEIQAKANAVYGSGKRLYQRAYFDSAAGKFIFPGRSGKIVAPEHFLLNVIGHVEEALRLDYIDVVMFPDLGHSHFFLPQGFYDREILHESNEAEYYQKMLAHRELKVIYHTGEQLKYKEEDGALLPDEKVRWRYYIRNLVGDNSGVRRLEIPMNSESRFNTVKSAEGYHYWGGGFNISASRDGCFPFKSKGRTLYFDLSLFDLPTDGATMRLQRQRESRH